MHLTVFNGSPRGRASNTAVFMEHFLKGFLATHGNTYEIAYLNQTQNLEKHARKFAAVDRIIVAFPLYTDAMPAVVKAFLELLEGRALRTPNLELGFVIQCGFPEALHLRYVEKYLEKLTRRLGCRYTGTIVKGAGEFIRVLPHVLNLHIYRRFRRLGKEYGRTGAFSRRMINRFAWYNRFPAWLLPFTWPIIDTAARNYWHRQLKTNKAYDKRFAQPYR